MPSGLERYRAKLRRTHSYTGSDTRTDARADTRTDPGADCYSDFNVFCLDGREHRRQSVVDIRRAFYTRCRESHGQRC